MKKPQNLLTQLLLVIVAIYVPVVALSIFSLSYSNSRLEDQVTDSIKIQQDNSILILDNALKDTYFKASTLLTDLDLIKLSVGPVNNQQRIASINALREKLTRLNEDNPYIEFIRIHIPYAGIAVSSNWSKEGSVQYYEPSEMDEVLGLSSFPHHLILRDERHSLYIFPRYYQFQNVIELALNTEAMHKYLLAESVIQDSRLMLKHAQLDTPIIEDMDEDAWATLNREANHLEAPTFIRRTLSPSGETHHLYKNHLDFLNVDFYSVIPSSAYFDPVERSITFTVFTMVFLVLSTVILFVGIVRLIHTPLHRLSDGFDLLSKGDFDIELPIAGTRDFNYIYDKFNQTVKDMDRLIQENYHKKLLLQQAHLRQMQAQINPHFLYNSFFMLKQMIRRGHQESSEAVAEKLGHYFRYITKVNSDMVTLGNEFDHALNYASIQALRFKNRIRIESDSLPEAYDQILVPKLILQPLIENAYNHGLENKVADGLIRLQIVADDHYLTFTFDDNGEHLTESVCHQIQEALSAIPTAPYSDKTGAIMNIAKRLYITYQMEGLLTFGRSPLGGARVLLKLPLNPLISERQNHV